MLTPPLAVSVDDDDLVPTRSTGFRIPVVDGQRVSQMLSTGGAIPFAELRLYSFQDGQVLPVARLLSDLPPHVSLQTWSSTLADQLEALLRSKHVPQQPGSDAASFKRFSIRYLSPWHHFDSCRADFEILTDRINSLETQVRSLRTEVAHLLGQPVSRPASTASMSTP